MTDVTTGGSPAVEQLAPWFADHLGVPAVEMVQVRRHAEGFSWQTFTALLRWTAPDGSTSEQGIAIRREPEDGLLAPYDIRRQYALHAALERHTSIPVPPLRWLELGPSVFGMPFYVMDRVEGYVPMQWDPDDPRAFPTESARRHIGEQFVDLLAELHAVDRRALDPDLGLPEVTDPEQAAVAEIDHWHSFYEKNTVRRVPLLEEAVSWLRANVAVSGRLSLTHGDYRIGNFMIDDDRRIVALFDWELAHVSDPVEDIAWAGLGLFRGRSPRWSHLLPQEEFLARYQDRTGLAVEDDVLRFWTVLSYLKATASHLCGARAFEDGRSDDLRLAAMGHRVLYVLKALRGELRTLRGAR